MLAMIPHGATIGCGDSVTLHQIGFFDWLAEQKNHEVFNPFFVRRFDFADDDMVGFSNQRHKLARKALTSDVFFSGTNAITLDGKLVNMDGNGNRVAPLIYGPNQVIIVTGYNKIVKDVDEALRRIKEWASPMNNKRHVNKHGLSFIAKLPCVKTGTCQSCRSESKGCRITAIIDGWNPAPKASDNLPPFIIIVGEAMGI